MLNIRLKHMRTFCEWAITQAVIIFLLSMGCVVLCCWIESTNHPQVEQHAMETKFRCMCVCVGVFMEYESALLLTGYVGIDFTS